MSKLSLGWHTNLTFGFRYFPFINYNNNTELAKFGLRNGGASGTGLLNEKWESLALVPADNNKHSKRGNKHGGHNEKDEGDEYFLFSLSDNDFRNSPAWT